MVYDNVTKAHAVFSFRHGNCCLKLVKGEGVLVCYQEKNAYYRIFVLFENLNI